ncbi:MAG: hypothetical protein ACPGWR_08775 [Ardenticatenaceae bacterium]
MNKKVFLELAENPNFISSIYNYCDRWCKRCPFTSRCLNYAMRKRDFADPETRDVNNEAFWQKLGESFQLALELLQDIAEKEGLDLDDIAADEAQEWEAERKRLDESARNQECTRAGKAYVKIADQWFYSAKNLFEEKGHELAMKVRLAVGDPIEEVASMEEAVEVIRWYQHQIWVKLMRAVRGQSQEKKDLELWQDFPKDSDGSAKVALVGIDRSLAAWAEMHKHFPEKQDHTLTILAHLDRLRHNTEQAFPHARAFVRPGFDTIELYM